MGKSKKIIEIDLINIWMILNITDFNQVFDSLLDGNYKFGLTQNLIAYVNNVYDYALCFRAQSIGYWFDSDKGADNFVNNYKVIFTDTISIISIGSWKPMGSGFNSIFIMGNGSTIDGNAEDDRDVKKWVEMNGDSNTMFAAYDLTVKNFNTAVECFGGQCYFNNVQFDNNCMKYIAERDWGAAFLNTGTVMCDNCIFTNNYAKNGGAIFNQGFLSLNNCTFKGNDAYGKGDDGCVGDGGRVQVDGNNVTSDTSNVYFTESTSMSDMTLMGVVVGVGAFAAGFLATVFTCNPVIGAVVGAAIGVGFGLFAAEQSIECSYDINFNRVGCCLIFVSVGIVTGALGGYVGSYAISNDFYIDDLLSNNGVSVSSDDWTNPERDISF